MEIKKINLDDVIYQQIVLRTHKETEEHIQWMYDDLLERGLLNLMSLIPSKDEKGKYIVSDGARRMTALKRMKKDRVLPKGFKTIDAMHFVVRDAQEELDTLGDMISGNANIKKTTNKQFIDAIYRIATETNISIEKLAKKIGMTKEYINRLFKTLKLGDEVLTKAQEQDITISNLITTSQLAGKIDDKEMDEWLKEAKKLSAGEYALKVTEELEILKEAVRGKVKEDKFVLTAKFIGKDSLEMLAVQCKSAFEQKGTPETEARYGIMLEIYQKDEPTARKREKEYEQKKQEKEKKAEARKQAREEANFEDSKKLLEEQGFKVTKK